MVATELDCRQLPCPEPVLRCRDGLAAAPVAPETLAVLVDNDAARENVSRYLASQGYAVEAQPLQEGQASERCPGWRLLARRHGAPEACQVMTSQDMARLTSSDAASKIVVFLPAATIGAGDDELGGKLMRNFLKTLPELGGELWRIILVNGGVFLAGAESPVLEELRALETAGVEILVCGACLEHFRLQRALGQTTSMLDVVASLQMADKVLRV